MSYWIIGFVDNNKTKLDIELEENTFSNSLSFGVHPYLVTFIMTVMALSPTGNPGSVLFAACSSIQYYTTFFKCILRGFRSLGGRWLLLQPQNFLSGINKVF